MSTKSVSISVHIQQNQSTKPKSQHKPQAKCLSIFYTCSIDIYMRTYYTHTHTTIFMGKMTYFLHHSHHHHHLHHDYISLYHPSIHKWLCKSCIKKKLMRTHTHSTCTTIDVYGYYSLASN